MIQIPYCLKCRYCRKNMKCNAYPEGIPGTVLHKKKEEGEICNNNVGYEEKVQEDVIKEDELVWDKFTGELLGYIREGQNSLIKTDYEIDLDMTDYEILQEFWYRKSIDELSPQLQVVAKQFLNTEKVKDTWWREKILLK